MRTSYWVPLLAIVCPALIATGFGQTPSPKLEFEVASIKPAEAPGPNGDVTVGLHIDGAQVRLNYVALRDIMRYAFRVKLFQVEGPDWITSQYFNVAAKLPDGATRDQVPEMLQNLLIDRFQMTYHRESKEFPVLGLVVGKNGLKAKLVPANEMETSANLDVAGSGSAAGVSVSFGKGAYYTFANDKFEVKHLTMPQIADSLARYEQDPVVDMTGAAGTYDFVLPLNHEDYMAMLIRAGMSRGVSMPPEAMRLLEMSTGDSLGAALETVGLKLERRRAPLPTIVVDKANKAPTSN